MEEMPLSVILTRLDEFRSALALEQKAVPFIEEVLDFLREIVPVLGEIDSSIRMSTSKMMPTATSRLASVNQATELAATEIMNLVEETHTRIKQTKEKIDNSRSFLDDMAEADRRLTDLIQNRLSEPELLAEVVEIMDEKQTLRHLMNETLEAKSKRLDEIRSNMNSIMMSLQVQDITSQQLASVSHLIDSVRSRLSKFEGRITSGNLNALWSALPPDEISFDENASYEYSGAKQALAEKLVAKFAAQDRSRADAPDDEGEAHESSNSMADIKNDIDGSSPTQSRRSPDKKSRRPRPASGGGKKISGAGKTLDAAEPASNGETSLNEALEDPIERSPSASQRDIDKLFKTGQ